jgi:hypothetical protein
MITLMMSARRKCNTIGTRNLCEAKIRVEINLQLLEYWLNWGQSENITYRPSPQISSPPASGSRPAEAGVLRGIDETRVGVFSPTFQQLRTPLLIPRA